MSATAGPSLADQFQHLIQCGFTAAEAEERLTHAIRTGKFEIQPPLPSRWRLRRSGFNRLSIETPDSYLDASTFACRERPTTGPLLLRAVSTVLPDGWPEDAFKAKAPIEVVQAAAPIEVAEEKAKGDQPKDNIARATVWLAKKLKQDAAQGRRTLVPDYRAVIATFQISKLAYKAQVWPDARKQASLGQARAGRPPKKK